VLRVLAWSRILLEPVAAVFSPNLKAVVEPVSAQFHIWGWMVELIVLEAVAAVIWSNLAAPPAPPQVPPESVITVAEDHFTQLLGVIAPVKTAMLAAARVA